MKGEVTIAGMLAAAMLAAVMAGCTTAPGRVFSVDEARAQSAELSGSRVSVTGRLTYAFEDHNLYQTRWHALNYDQGHCLSLGIAHGAAPDLAAANGLDVIITGVLTDDFCPPDSICLASCSRVGLFVETVRARTDHGRVASKP